MTKIDVKANISAPSEINIPLVRGDHQEMSNIFRIFFEVSLACFSGTLGAVLTMPQTPTFYWVVLSIFGCFGLASLKFTFSFGKSSEKVL